MKLQKSDINIIIDTREQKPLDFPKARVTLKSLYSGDYSVAGYENQFAIERKSLPDLLGSLGQHRERFFKEIQRLKAHEYSALIIETSLSKLYKGKWRSKISINSVIGSLQALSVRHGVNVFWCENRELSAKFIEGLAYHFIRNKLIEQEKLNKYVN